MLTKVTEKPVVVIIGGGLCGTALAIQLSRFATTPVSIVIINKNHQLSKGVAFSTLNAAHLLNVAAGKMSLFADQPDHFCQWILRHQNYSQYQHQDLPSMFLPRYIYGEYLVDVFNRFRMQLPSFIDLKIIEDEATDIILTGHGPVVELKSGFKIPADKIVLATGNAIPGNPEISNRQFYENSKAYFRNPWVEDAVNGLEDETGILIIGTGLTMVDNVLSLVEKGFKGKINAVSTKGFFPLSHKKTSPYHDILDEFKTSMTLLQQYHTFKKHIRKVLKSGITGEVVVDAIRPLTPEIWQFLSTAEKKSFMQHIRHLWGVARHRLPEDVHQRVTGLIHSGQLEIIAGRLYNMEERPNKKINASIKLRRTGLIIEMEYDRIINCTGPQSDIRKVENALFRNLLAKGLLVPDPMKLGVNANPDGTLISDSHVPSTWLFTLGANLKGILWESVAVPELRVQAEKLAAKLIHQLTESVFVEKEM